MTQRQHAAIKSAAGAVIFIVYIIPIYWMFVSSLKPRSEIYQIPPTIFPEQPQLASFARVISDGGLINVANSFFIAGFTVLFTLVIAAPGAYALARFKKKWTRFMVLLFLMAQMMPTVLMATPLFAMFSRMGINNTLLAVIIGNATMTIPFAVIVLRTVFLGVSVELEEAAYIDGCTMAGMFFRVVLPVGKAGLVIASVIAFILAWGDFIYANTFINNSSLFPATVAMFNYVGALATDWSAIMAFAALIAIPLIILFIMLQKHVVVGLSAGALKM